MLESCYKMTVSTTRSILGYSSYDEVGDEKKAAKQHGRAESLSGCKMSAGGGG